MVESAREKQKPKAQLEDYWAPFEKSATKDLVEEFNSAATEQSARITRTKRAETRGVEEDIDMINACYSDSDELGGPVQWKEAIAGGPSPRLPEREEESEDVLSDSEARKAKITIEPLETITERKGNVDEWFQALEDECRIRGIPRKLWNIKLLDLTGSASRTFIDPTDYEISKANVLRVFGIHKTPLREVYEIEEEPDEAMFKVKQAKGMRKIEDYELYAKMASYMRRLTNPELREALLNKTYHSWSDFLEKVEMMKYKYPEKVQGKVIAEVKDDREQDEEEVEIDALRRKYAQGRRYEDYRGKSFDRGYGRGYDRDYDRGYRRGFNRGNEWRRKDTPWDYTRNTGRKCYFCGAPGHLVRDCPKIRELREKYEAQKTNHSPQGKKTVERRRPWRTRRRWWFHRGRRIRVGNYWCNLGTGEYKPRLGDKVNVIGALGKGNDARCVCTLSLPNGVRVDALVDTGSAVNVMNKELWKVIGSPKLTETKDKFVSVNRGKMNVLGKCTVNTLVKGKDEDCVFYVFDEEITQPIMGWEGLTKFGGEISLEKGTWEPGNQRGICAIAQFLSEDRKEKDLESVFEKFPKVFCQRMEKAGQCTAGEGEIELLNDTPVYTALPPMSQAMKEELRVLVKDMLSRGVIEKSKSNYASNAVLVTKKSGKKRVTTSYKKLNERIRADRFPLPRIDQIVQEFTNVRFFSKIDLIDGYWQIKLRERDRPYTAFHTPDGLYQYKVLPQGLSSSPAIFQRIMSSILEENIGKFVRVYIDDILIFSKTWEEHLKHIEWVLGKLEEAHLVLSKEKCEWGKESIEFLGHLIDDKGVHITEFRTEKMKNYPIPRNPKEVQRAMGLFNYVRRFIPNFSKIALPITRLERKDVKFEWTEECQKAWDTLKEKATQAPILAFPQSGRPFELHTDASKL